jgi:FkbM family methyltransferase
VISSALHYAAWPEFHELQWLRGILRPGDVVLDVGANVGHISLLLADIVGPDGLFAFEPAAVAFERLRENWRLNGWRTDQLFNVAVGARDGEVSIASATTPLTTVGVSSVPTENGVKVELRALDDLRARWRGRRVGLLKVDVEGYETEVLQGARALLAEDRPRAVMFESLSGALAPEIATLFSDAGYRVFGLDVHGRPDSERTAAQNLFAESRDTRPPIRVCVCTCFEAAIEPRAPRHAVALASRGEGVNITFIDSAPKGAEARPVLGLKGLTNLTWRTHRFPTRATDPVGLALQRTGQALAQLAFRAGLPARAAALSTRAIGLSQDLEETHADVYVAHGIETLRLACRVAARKGGLVVFDSMEFHSDMGDAQTPIERAITRAIERECLPLCALVLASSDQVADALVQEYGITRPLVLHNVPPREMDIPTSVEPGLALYWRNAVLGLGQRGLEDALIALTRLPPDVTLHLQGRLPLDGGRALRTRIDSLGLGTRVIIHPPHRPEDAVREAARFTVGLCLERAGVRNHDLTVSNKIFDYHMAGLAVIASDLPGLRGVIERSGGGLLFQPGSADDLALQIRRLHEDTALRQQLAARAREFALREGNREREMERFLAAFDEVWRNSRDRADRGAS